MLFWFSLIVDHGQVSQQEYRASKKIPNDKPFRFSEFAILMSLSLVTAWKYAPVGLETYDL
jgi:hypothetical protein